MSKRIVWGVSSRYGDLFVGPAEVEKETEHCLFLTERADVFGYSKKVIKHRTHVFDTELEAVEYALEEAQENIEQAKHDLADAEKQANGLRTRFEKLAAGDGSVSRE